MTKNGLENLIEDEIISIEYIGKRNTIDITVEDSHMYFANDIYTHNSGFSAEWLEAGHTGGSIKRVQKTHLLLSIAKTQAQRENDLANIKIIKARFAKDGQQIEDCIFNNDTLEIRATNNSWRSTVKKYDEKDLESIEDKTLRLHAEVSNFDEVYNITDNKESIMSNLNFDNESTINSNIENKKEEIIFPIKNTDSKYGDVDDFIKNLMEGKLDNEDKNIINNLMDNK